MKSSSMWWEAVTHARTTVLPHRLGVDDPQVLLHNQVRGVVPQRGNANEVPAPHVDPVVCFVREVLRAAQVEVEGLHIMWKRIIYYAR